MCFVNLKPESLCKPKMWSGYDSVQCGSCAALVNVSDYGGTCSKFCSAQGLGCLNGWDDVEHETCSFSAAKQGCKHVFKGTSDAICLCFSPGKVFYY